MFIHAAEEDSESTKQKLGGRKTAKRYTSGTTFMYQTKHLFLGKPPADQKELCLPHLKCKRRRKSVSSFCDGAKAKEHEPPPFCHLSFAYFDSPSIIYFIAFNF